MKAARIACVVTCRRHLKHLDESTERFHPVVAANEHPNDADTVVDRDTPSEPVIAARQVAVDFAVERPLT